MLAGVPWLSVTSDISKSIRIQLVIYAENICIYDQNRSPQFAHLAAQRHLHEIGRWTAEWRIDINADRTTAVIFSKKTRL